MHEPGQSSIVAFDGFALAHIDEPGIRQLIAWRSDPEVYEWYGGRPADAAEIRAEIAEEAGIVTPCTITLDGRPIGFLQFYEYTVEEWRAAVGLDPAEADVWGIDLFLAGEADRNRGLGTRLMRGVVRFLAAERGARRVLIDPHLANPRAIRCYTKAGFRPVRVLLDHEEHAGEMRDALLMEWIGNQESDQPR